MSFGGKRRFEIGGKLSEGETNPGEFGGSENNRRLGVSIKSFY